MALANGRVSDRSFRRYRRIRPFLKRVLGEVDLFLMQGEAHAERVQALGAPPGRVRVTGNLKFDAVEPGRPPDRLARLIQGRPPRSRPLWIAGSTVGGEEELVLQAFHRVREQVGDAGLVLAPRHPERFDGVPPLVEAAGFRCRRRSSLEPDGWQDEEVLLLDTLGELARLYSLASVVFIGKTLVSFGGHNIIEPAAAGRPVVIGPHMENFQEIADQFLAADAVVQVETAEELGQEVAALMLDEPRRRALGERAQAVVDLHRGATGRTVSALSDLMT